MTDADLVLVVIASLVGSFVKSVTGMGYPLIAIPFLSLFIDVETAVAVVAIPNTVANLLLNLDVASHRHETRDLPRLIVASVVAAVLGTVVLVNAAEEPLLLGLAATVFGFVILRIRRPELSLDTETTHRWAPAAGAAAGFSQGAVGVSGPIVAMWFHGYRLGKDAYVYSVTLVFLVAGAAQLAVLVGTGEYDRDRIVAAVLALIATLAMIPLGTRMRGRIEGRTFENLILGLLVASGASLVLRAVG